MNFYRDLPATAFPSRRVRLANSLRPEQQKRTMRQKLSRIENSDLRRLRRKDGL